jgi:hypothetical protein
LRIHARPALRRPLFLAAFGGWGDAGSGATGAVGYLLGEPAPAACATLDPEACFDFTVERPITRRGSDGRWRLDYPEIGLFAIECPEQERDLLLLRGPEPHNNWHTVAREIAGFVSELGTELGLTMGAFIGAVSHRRVPLARRTLNPELDARLSALGLEETPYSGPTAFVTALLHAMDDAGIPAASLWAAGPPYLGAPNPALSLALLEGVERVTDTALGLGRLQGIATDFLRKVESALRENPEVAERLGKLVELGDPEPAEAEASQPEGPPDLPSGADLVERLEAFLRESRGEDDGPPPRS